MAKSKIVAVRDKAVGAFGVPNFVPNVGGMVRSFGDEVNREGTAQNPNNLNLHPGDFDLYYLGEYDDETGEFSPTEEKGPVKIASGLDYAKKV